MRNILHFDALIFILKILYERSFLHFACNTLILAYCKYYMKNLSCILTVEFVYPGN